MIISVKKSESEQLLVHLVKVEFNYPRQEANVAGQTTLADVYKTDAELLAQRIKKHLDKRTSIRATTISSSYATVEFTAITPDSLFCSVLGSEPGERVTVDYMVGVVNPDNGKEERETKFTVSELGWKDDSAKVGVSFLHNYYRSIYLLAIADEMRSKNPGGYLTLKNNSDQIGSLPSLAANLNEQIIGSTGNSGLFFSNVYPIPGSVIEAMAVSDYPHLQSLGTDKIESRVNRLLVQDPLIDISSVVEQVRDSELGTIDSGLSHVYVVSFSGSRIDITERMFNHLLGRRQELIWCFSELSRCFEMAGVVNVDHISRNLRSFQYRLKSLLNSDLTVTLFPESSPRDLEDLIIQLFPSTHRPVYKLIKQIDPNRVLFSFKKISGDDGLFNKIKSSNKFLSPGLIASIPYYTNAFVPQDTDGDLGFKYSENGKQIVFKLEGLTDHTSDKISFSEYMSIINNGLTDYLSLINVVFWLNTETKDEYLIDVDNPTSMSLFTPNHLLRKYSGLPIFDGFLKAKVLKGLF